MPRSILTLTCCLTLLAGCEPDPTRAELAGFWGRVIDGEHEVFEFAEQIDATGLTDVRPAFRMHRYPVGEFARDVKRGRWDVIYGDLILTPTWSLDESEINRTTQWQIVEVTERDLRLQLDEDSEETLDLVTLTTLP